MLDITERKAAEEQIAFLAYHDKLTGLPNRAMFDELLELALARARRADLGVAVLSVDLDNFKLVNDSLGPRGRRRAASRSSPTGCRTRRATPTSWRARAATSSCCCWRDLDRTRAHAGRRRTAPSIVGRGGRRRACSSASQEPFEVGGTELYLTASVGHQRVPAGRRPTRSS